MRRDPRRLLRIVVALALFPGFAPAAGARDDLPPADEVIKKVIQKAKQDAEDKKEANYLYSMHSLTDQLDERGSVKEHRDRLYQIVILDGERYQRLVEKDGKPLTPDDQKREQERERKFRQTAAERKRKKASHDDDVVLNEELFARYKIAIVDREPVNGRPALVATFEPKGKDLPTRRRIDFVLNKLAGRFWIDEQDYDIPKAQFHLTEPATKFAGLLASIRKFDASFEQVRLDDGVWLPSRFENSMEGRVVFKSMYQRSKVQWSDYKRAE